MTDAVALALVADDLPAQQVPLLQVVDSLGAYLALTTELTKGKQLWFRGTRRSSHKLEPSLYRHPVIKDIDALLRLEWELLLQFKHRAPPFTHALPSTELELLFLMQHYGVPTRLLDWTENPLIALFFALEDARKTEAAEENAAVWVLDPHEMNKRSNEHMGGIDTIPGADPEALADYSPAPHGRGAKRMLPMAIYGIHNSARIVNQRGGFVMFGRDTAPIEQNGKLNGGAGVVRKIEIAREAKADTFMKLFGMGVSDSVIYPDLDGLGREIKNRSGF